MKRYSILLISFNILISVYSAHAIILDPGGFRGIDWGTDIDSINKGQFVLVRKGDGLAEEIASYTIKNDNLNVLGVVATRINYGFFQGKFYNASIYFNDKDGVMYDVLKTKLIGTFGNTFDLRDEPDRKCIEWSGDKTAIVLIKKIKGNEVEILFASKKITDYLPFHYMKKILDRKVKEEGL